MSAEVVALSKALKEVSQGESCQKDDDREQASVRLMLMSAGSNIVC